MNDVTLSVSNRATASRGTDVATSVGTPEATGFSALLASALSSAAPLALDAEPQGEPDGEDAETAAPTGPPVEDQATGSGAGLTDQVLTLLAAWLPRARGEAAAPTGPSGPPPATGEPGLDGHVPVAAEGSGQPDAVGVEQATAAVIDGVGAGAGPGTAPSGRPGTPVTGTTVAPQVTAATAAAEGVPAAGLPAPAPIPTATAGSAAVAPGSIAPGKAAAAPPTPEVPPATVAPEPGSEAALGTTLATATAASVDVDAPAPPDGAHARMIGRVMDALELLEKAPPPRRMTIELPDADGLRLHVALRGAEVHVSLVGGSADLTGWGRELTTALAARGFHLGSFSGGTGEGKPRDPRGRPAESEAPQAPARPRRPGQADRGLRL